MTLVLFLSLLLKNTHTEIWVFFRIQYSIRLVIRVQDEVRPITTDEIMCVSVPRRWVSQAKKIVSSRFSSQMRLISAMFSFLLSEVTVDTEQQPHTHTHKQMKHMTSSALGTATNVMLFKCSSGTAGETKELNLWVIHVSPPDLSSSHPLRQLTLHVFLFFLFSVFKTR